MQYKVVEGNYDGSGKKYAIVTTRFNDFITQKLTDGALDTLVRHNVKPSDITIYKVPGAFEIPYACKKIAEQKEVDAIIAIGAVIRGATSHYDLVTNESTKGIAQISLATGMPIAFGIITTDTIEQAVERAGTKSGNKGSDAAMTALELSNLFFKR